MMKKCWLGVLLMIPMQSWAAPGGFTPAEVAMCEALGMPSHGGQYQGHYCEGLINLNRAYASVGDERRRSYALSVAIDNFNYELRRKDIDQNQRAERHVGKARALKLMGRKAEATAEFHKALSYKITSPDVYQALADHFHETGNNEKALDMATEGLKLNPYSKGLKRRYTEFGGKLPYPEALAKSAPSDETKVGVKPEPKSESKEATEGITGEILKPNNSTTIEPAQQAEPSKVGTPKNPYCRFCPD